MASSKNIFVFENNDALSTDVAKFVAEKSAKAIEERGKFTVAFSGGSLPNLVGSLCFFFFFFFFFFLSFFLFFLISSPKNS